MPRLRVYIFAIISFLMIILCCVPVYGVQIQLFGISSIDGVLSVEYEDFTASYDSGSTTSSSSLAQNYDFQIRTFILHPKFLTWDINGDFGVSRSGDETSFNNKSYGTSLRLLRDFFISGGYGYNVGTDEVKVPYAPSYIREREQQSADFSIRLRHFPTSFTYQSTSLASDAKDYEQDSTEKRLGVNTNIWFGRRFRGTFRTDLTQIEDRLAEDPKTKYYNVSLSSSWNNEARDLYWNSSIRLYNKQLPDSADSLSISEQVTFRKGLTLGAGANFSFSNNNRDDYGEKRLGVSGNVRYSFTEDLSASLNADLKKLEYNSVLDPTFLQDTYEVGGKVDYRVRQDGLTYYATGSGSFLQRNVDGGRQVYTSEILTFDELNDIKLKHAYPSEIKVWDEHKTNPEPYEENVSYKLWYGAEGYVTIHRMTDVDPEVLLPNTVLVEYAYTPDRDDKVINGSLKVGLDKKLAENVTLTSYVTGGLHKSLANEEEDPTKSYQVYLGTLISHDRLDFNGSVSVADRINSITTEVKYTDGSLDFTGRYTNEFSDKVDPRHNLLLTGRYYTYIPIGVRLTLQGTERRVYQNGELIDGSFNMTTSGKYPLRRFMWLKDELKFDFNHICENSMRWSNFLGFEWNQGMLSLASGYEVVSNKLTRYKSHRLTFKASRRF